MVWRAFHHWSGKVMLALVKPAHFAMFCPAYIKNKVEAASCQRGAIAVNIKVKQYGLSMF
jgi:hypothetical protein